MGDLKLMQAGKTSVGRDILLSVLICIAVFIVGMTVITALVSAGNVDEAGYRPYTIAALVLSAFLGSMAAVRKQNWAVVAASAAIYYILLVCTNILLFDGVFAGIGWGTAAVAFGTLAAVAVKTVREASGKKTKYKYRYR